MPLGKRKTSQSSAASNVCEDTLALHSVSDDSRRAIFNATCKALGMTSEQVQPTKWKKIAEAVLPDVFYPLELTAVEEGKPRGARLTAKTCVAEKRKLTATQVKLLQTPWTPAAPHKHNTQTRGVQTVKGYNRAVGKRLALKSPEMMSRPCMTAYVLVLEAPKKFPSSPSMKLQPVAILIPNSTSG